MWSLENLVSHSGAALVLISVLSSRPSSWVKFSGCGAMKKSTVAGSFEDCAEYGSRHHPQLSAEGVLPCMNLGTMPIMRVQVPASSATPGMPCLTETYITAGFATLTAGEFRACPERKSA